jgi:hypothetical protein
MDGEATKACHELLLRLAGRLPDRQLWRFRDWLSAGALDALAGALPLTLLRERVPITITESMLLNVGLVDAGADVGLLNSIQWVDELGDLDYTFSPESPERVAMGDSVAVVLGAVLHGRPEVIDVRGSWRQHRLTAAGQPTRVVLITAVAQCARLTGELQRLLRALGTYEPGVEVMPEGIDLLPYHRRALAASEPLLPGMTAYRRQPVPR